MDFRNIIILIIGLITISLGIFIQIKNPKSSANFWYFLLCIFGGSWIVAKAFQLEVMDLNQQDIIVKVVYIFGILAPFAYLMLSNYFPIQEKMALKTKKFFIYFIPLILIMLISFGILRPHETAILNNNVYRSVNFLDFFIFAIYFFSFVVWGFIILFEKYLASAGVLKEQIKYLILATIGTFLTTGLVSVILLLFNNFSYDWLGAIFLLIHFSVAGYFIFLKNIKLTVKT